MYIHTYKYTHTHTHTHIDREIDRQKIDKIDQIYKKS